MQCKKSLVSIHESKRPPPYAQPPPMVSMGTKLKKQGKSNPNSKTCREIELRGLEGRFALSKP